MKTTTTTRLQPVRAWALATALACATPWVGAQAPPAPPAPPKTPDDSRAGAALWPMIPMSNIWQMQSAAGYLKPLAAAGEKRVQIRVSLKSELNEARQPQNYGLECNPRPGVQGRNFYPFDAMLRDEIKGCYLKTFAECVKQQLGIAVLLHLDSYGKIQDWRQQFDFDPLAPVAGVTYEQAVVQPVLEALEQTVPADWPIEVSLQGEMATTVFKYPQSWQKVLDKARARGKLKRVTFGLSFNHEGVMRTTDDAQRAALRALWNQCDFIGISMYQKVSDPPRADDFTLNVGRFIGEFIGQGCPIPEGKPLHMVEVGLGGGGYSATDKQNHVPALVPADALRSPFFGTGKVEENPWTSAAMKEVRRQYYAALCQFLAKPMARHPVTVAYQWSMGSWDVHGIAQPVFGDPAIVKGIRAYNQKLIEKQ